ncbi:MAG: thiamine-phosphate kinase [Rhodospirillaceae bacterium]|nr:thiamine-phosphate kinase [Rhodospirillaceae bacterium]MBT7613285.1 thiamine-phosphate kinase [Rhodospirillaceae bacterium]
MIERLIAPLATEPGARGLTDDGVVFTPGPGMDLAMTKDMLAEGVHFLPDDPPDLIARKALRTNLSDLAAMGARPFGYLLGLASDGTRDEFWLEKFVEGLAEDQARYGISLLGGDTIVATKGIMTLSITAVGEVPKGLSLARDRARHGDLIAVTGTIGDAALGLRVRRQGLLRLPGHHRNHLETRYRLPLPRVDFGQAILGKANAAIDISDGLLADAGHIARRSGLAIDLLAADVPFSEAATALVAADPDLRLTTMVGGDDYELLVAVPPDHIDAVRQAAQATNTNLTVVGRCKEGRGVRLLDERGTNLADSAPGWRHHL